MIARAFALAIAIAGPELVEAQTSQPVASRDSLTKVLVRAGLDTATMGVLVYYVPGSESNARELGTLLAANLRYVKSTLGIDVDLALAVVDSARWPLISGLPYGLPSSHGEAGIAYLPHTPTGPDADAFLRVERTVPPGAMEAIRRQYPTYAAAVARMLNLVMLHEVGHVVTRALPIHAPNRWFYEWLASYLAFAFMQSERRQDAELWEAMCEAMLAGNTPPHRTLEDFEGGNLSRDHYIDNYLWYQTAFQPGVRVIHDQQGIGFVRSLRREFGAEIGPRPSPSDLLARLERMAPGFVPWATRMFRP